jgi:hypothetical protein
LTRASDFLEPFSPPNTASSDQSLRWLVFVLPWVVVFKLPETGVVQRDTFSGGTKYCSDPRTSGQLDMATHSSGFTINTFH